MARPSKIGLDYFPVDVNIDEKIELIEAEHGMIGFAIVIKLWQRIYGGEGYYMTWDDDSALLFSRRINTELTTINSVINSCFRRKLFDLAMYEKYGVLTSKGIQKRYFQICQGSKRKRTPVLAKLLLISTDEFPPDLIEFIPEETIINSELTPSREEFMPEESTQSKVKESKVKESKVKERKEKERKEYSCPESNDSGRDMPKNKDTVLQEQAEKVILHLNAVVGKKYDSKNKNTIAPVMARLREGVTLEACMRVIDIKAQDPYFKAKPQFMRATTLFSSKFYDYIQENPAMYKNGDKRSYEDENEALMKDFLNQQRSLEAQAHG